MTIHGLMWVPSLCIYVKMCALMCMRPESAEKYGLQSEPINCVLIGTIT